MKLVRDFGAQKEMTTKKIHTVIYRKEGDTSENLVIYEKENMYVLDVKAKDLTKFPH